MKKVTVKDVEVSEEKDVKKINIKKILLIILLVIVSLVGIFFWSTKIRWDAQIEDYHEVLYYGQEEVKIESLIGFYDEELEIDIKDDEAILAYCDSEFGGDCVTGDFNNSFENLLREPSIVISIVILIDVILLLILSKDNYYSKVKIYVIFGLILLYGAISLGKVVFEVADYYFLVNDTEFVTTAKVERYLITNNKDEYYPVVRYTSEQGEFVNYIEVPMKESKKELTIYYDKVDNSKAISKKSLVEYVLPLIVGILYIVLSIVFLIKKRKERSS